jgi:hypothetical protein
MAFDFGHKRQPIPPGQIKLGVTKAIDSKMLSETNFSTETGGRDPIIKPLQGLRGIAAGTVLIGHISPVPTAPSLGVVLFFVISGFLMGKIYLPKRFPDYAST